MVVRVVPPTLQGNLLVNVFFKNKFRQHQWVLPKIIISELPQKQQKLDPGHF